MATYWAFDVDGDMPILTGPYASADEQKRVVRAKRTRGSRAYWLDVVGGEPQIGRVTVSDGDQTPAPVAGLAEPAPVHALVTAAHAFLAAVEPHVQGCDDDTVNNTAAALQSAVDAVAAPVAGVSAEERAQIQESVARLRTEQERATGGWRSGLDRAMDALVPHVDRLLAALDAAEARAAKAERDLADQVSKTEDALRWQARTERACAQAEREREEARGLANEVWPVAVAAVQSWYDWDEKTSASLAQVSEAIAHIDNAVLLKLRGLCHG